MWQHQTKYYQRNAALPQTHTIGWADIIMLDCSNKWKCHSNTSNQNMNGLLLAISEHCFGKTILTLTRHFLFSLQIREPSDILGTRDILQNGGWYKMKVAALIILGCLVWEGTAKPEFPGQLRHFFLFIGLLPLLDMTMTLFSTTMSILFNRDCFRKYYSQGGKSCSSSPKSNTCEPTNQDLQENLRIITNICSGAGLQLNSLGK